MEAVVKNLGTQIAKLSLLSPATISNLQVKIQKSSVKLCDISSISLVNQSFVVKVPETQYIKFIENAIRSSNLGLNPVQKNNTLVLNIPRQTADQRKNLEKQIKKLAEDSKIALRSLRNSEMKKIKSNNEDLEKNLKQKVQSQTDFYVAKVDELVKKAVKEL